MMKNEECSHSCLLKMWVFGRHADAGVELERRQQKTRRMLAIGEWPSSSQVRVGRVRGCDGCCKEGV